MGHHEKVLRRVDLELFGKGFLGLLKESATFGWCKRGDVSIVIEGLENMPLFLRFDIRPESSTKDTEIGLRNEDRSVLEESDIGKGL